MITPKKSHYIAELRPAALRMARLSADAAPALIEELREWTFSPGQSVAEEVRSFAELKGTACALADTAIYPANRALRHLTVDAAKGKETDFLLGFIKKSVGFEPEDFSAYCLSPTDGSEVDVSEYNKQAVMLCGAPKEEIRGSQDALIAQAVHPRRLEIGTLGMVGALQNYLASSDDASPILFLEIDQECACVVIVGGNGVEMARKIDCGTKHIATALKEEMSLKDDISAERILQSRDFDLGPMAGKLLRKLMRELQSSIGFFEVQTGSSVSRLVSFNQGLSQKWLDDSICDLLNLSPLQVDVDQWLAKNEITYDEDVEKLPLDVSWLSLFSLALEFNKKGEDS